MTGSAMTVGVEFQLWGLCGALLLVPGFSLWRDGWDSGSGPAMTVGVEFRLWGFLWGFALSSWVLAVARWMGWRVGARHDSSSGMRLEDVSFGFGDSVGLCS